MLKRSRIAMAVLALAFAAAPTVNAGHESGRPFEASIEGLALYGFGPVGQGTGTFGLANVFDCNVGTGLDDFWKVTTFSTADGIATHLGRVHLEGAHCPTPTGPTQGQMAIVAANGDVLYGEYSGTYDPNLVTIEFKSGISSGTCHLLNDVPCASTGRFADVDGSAQMNFEANPGDPNDLWVPWSLTGGFLGMLDY